jgi:hypothetical protein
MLEDGVNFDIVRWNRVGSGSVLIVDRRKHEVMTFCTTNVTPFVQPPEVPQASIPSIFNQFNQPHRPDPISQSEAFASDQPINLTLRLKVGWLLSTLD